GHMPDFFNSNGPLKGHKRDLYEGGIRVPLVARWPGKIKPGTVTNHVSAHWDIFPTLCEVTGKAIPQNIDGISFLPVLLGKNNQREHKYLYWEFHERSGARAIRLGNWKVIQRNIKKNPNPPIEIYDLSSDLGETKNLGEEKPELIKNALKIFKEAHSPSPIWKMRWER
ncbi:MAG: sulfatase/phosphatase domain-containing protein, partial [Verrucomicrobiota bacterium]|nr:sulfatase/phosphatase domain-containing protein [Verrucomicrobiota bacterium]